ncbi:MAG: hypothetical protein ACE5IY_08435 [bacterium]
MFLHASHNLYIQGVFDRMTTDTGTTKVITGEFGAALAIAAAIIAGVFCLMEMNFEKTTKVAQKADAIGRLKQMICCHC